MEREKEEIELSSYENKKKLSGCGAIWAAPNNYKELKVL